MLENAKIKNIEAKRISMESNQNVHESMDESGVNFNNSSLAGSVNEETLKNNRFRENDSGNETYLSSMVSLTTNM